METNMRWGGGGGVNVMLLRSPETVFTCKDNMRRDEKLYFSAFVSKCKVSQGSQTFC